jgi:hypothetical protein
MEASNSLKSPEPLSNLQPLRKSPNKILSLTVKIIQHIASPVGTPSAASFSLSCHQIFNILGNSYIKHVQILSGPLLFRGYPLILNGNGSLIDPGWFYGKPADRWEFLHLLDRDIPDKILCYVCYKFHSPSDCKVPERRTTRLDELAKPCLQI